MAYRNSDNITTPVNIFLKSFRPGSYDITGTTHVKETDKTHDIMGLSHDAVNFTQHLRRSLSNDRIREMAGSVVFRVL